MQLDPVPAIKTIPPEKCQRACNAKSCSGFKMHNKKTEILLDVSDSPKFNAMLTPPSFAHINGMVCKNQHKYCWFPPENVREHVIKI